MRARSSWYLFIQHLFPGARRTVRPLGKEEVLPPNQVFVTHHHRSITVVLERVGKRGLLRHKLPAERRVYAPSPQLFDQRGLCETAAATAWIQSQFPASVPAA